MSSVVRLVQNDTGPDLTISLSDKNNSGNPLDLTGLTTAVMYFRAINTTVLLATITLSVVSPAANGQLLLVWPAGSLNQVPGTYQGEVSMTFGTKVITIYDLLTFQIRAQVG